MRTNLLVDKIHDMLVEKQRNNNRDQSYWHPSEIGYCPRKMALKKLGIQATNPPEDYHQLAIFDNGHSLHHRYQTWFREINVLATDRVVTIQPDYQSTITGKKNKVLIVGETGFRYPFRKHDHLWIVGNCDKNNPWTHIRDVKEGDQFYLVETPFEYPEWYMSGNVDAIINVNGHWYVNDIKSTGESGFNSLFFDPDRDGKSNYPKSRECHICGLELSGMKENMPLHLATKHSQMAKAKKEHIVQVNAYMHVLKEGGLPIQNGSILYENKNRQNAVEIMVDEDKKLIKRIDNICKKLWEIVDEKGKIPKKPKEFDAHCFDCTFCEYKDYCWPRDENTKEPQARKKLNLKAPWG